MAQQIEAMKSQALQQSQAPVHPPMMPPQGGVQQPQMPQQMPQQGPQMPPQGPMQPPGGMPNQLPNPQVPSVPGQENPLTAVQMMDVMRNFEDERKKQNDMASYQARMDNAKSNLLQLSEQDPELKKLLEEKGKSLPNEAIVQAMEFGNGDTKRGAGYLKHVLERDKLRLELEKSALEHQLNIGDVSKTVKNQISEYLRPSEQGGGDISEPDLSSQSLKAGDDPMEALLEYARSPDRL
jgi:hypothetical protein